MTKGSDYVGTIKALDGVNVLNKERDDLSPEYILQLMVIYINLRNAETVAYHIADRLGAIGVHSTFVHDKRRYFTRARESVDTLIKMLDLIFEEDFEEIFYNENSKVVHTPQERYEALQELSNDMLLSQFVYMSRANRANLRKALANFKAEPQFGNVQSVLDMYELKTFKH